MSDTSTPQRFFFIHVMKTAGATLYTRYRAEFGPDEVYPDPDLDPDMRGAYFRMRDLLAVPPDRLACTRLFSGHFPFAAVAILGIPLTTLTVLRHPVGRTLSLLRAVSERGSPRRSMEEVYEDPFVFAAQIHNHQTKMFALQPSDRFDSFLSYLDVTPERLALAKENLDRVDLVGVQEQFEGFCRVLEERFGWKQGPAPDRHVSATRAAPPGSLVRRIEEDNAADMEFYEHALAISARHGTS